MKPAARIPNPRRRAGAALCLWLMLLVMSPGSALSAPGDLDRSFDGDGKRTIDYGGDNDGATGLALRPDGRIVIGGHGNPLKNFAIQSLLHDGSGDPSFDVEGSLGINFGGPDYSHAVAIQPDGKVLVAGFTAANLAIARVNPDGTPDTSFDGDGRRTIDYGGLDAARALALYPDVTKP